ncbi:hypothetical protein ACQY0O_000085 [Thecaphora frezii]
MTPGPSSMLMAGAHDVTSTDDTLPALDSAPASSASQRRNSSDAGSAVQPKTCAQCGQQLDERSAASPAPEPSLPAPSPSSIAFAPEGLLQHGQAPSSSLTSAINAAAAAALSRHLAATAAAGGAAGAETEGQAICSRCTAVAFRERSGAARTADSSLEVGPSDASRSATQLSGIREDVEMHEGERAGPAPAASGIDAPSRRPGLDAVASRQEAAHSYAHRSDQERRSAGGALGSDHAVSAASASRSTAAANAAPGASSVSATSPTAALPSSSLLTSPIRRQAPWAAPLSPPPPPSNPGAALSINVGNMGAGGDATGSQTANDFDFPPLGRAATSPTLRAPTSPGRSPTRDRSRLRFVPGSPPTSTSRFGGFEEHNPATATSPVLGRSGSFSRSLSYNAPALDGTGSGAQTAPVVSFPPVSGPHQSAPHGHHQPQASPGRLRRSSSSSSSGIGVPAPAGAVPGAARARRSSVTRRPSRSSSSTGPTSIAFALVGASASSTDLAAPFVIEEDPYGPGSVTRPRLSTIPTHAIVEGLSRGGLSNGRASMSMYPATRPYRDPSVAVKVLPDPFGYPYVARSSGGVGGTAVSKASMDLDPPDSSAGAAARIRIDEARWYDPLRPDPLMELSRLRSPPRGRGCLFPGASFNGTQKSGRNSYDVTVRIVNVDIEASHLCGYLNIRGLTEDWPELTTYFDAEIIGDRYGFVTGKWGATEADDLKHWARFAPFRPLRSGLTKPGMRFNHLNKPYVFMRWKERFLVPDHQVRDINGASFAGFYYVCVELGDGGSCSSGGGGHRSTQHTVRSTNGGEPHESSVTSQWYAARANRRRERDVHLPTSASASGANGAANHAWPLSPPAASGAPPPSSSSFSSLLHAFNAATASPHRKEREDEWRREESMTDVDAGETGGKMMGFYFHENSEPYQQLSLHHVAERGSSGFELR